MEAHHLIPLGAQKNFDYSLDITPNIVSLCPNCHRAIHLSDIKTKIEILKVLFTAKKKKQLKNCGIVISMEDVIALYT